MNRFAIFMWNILLHHLPHFVGHGNTVAIEVHGNWRDDMCFGAVADSCCQRLPGQHVCAVELAGDDPVQQYFPVGLRLQRYKKTFIFEIPFLIGHCQRGHVGQFDETEFDLVFFYIQRLRFRSIKNTGTRQYNRCEPGRSNKGRSNRRRFFYMQIFSGNKFP